MTGNIEEVAWIVGGMFFALSVFRVMAEVSMELMRINRDDSRQRELTGMKKR